MSCPEAPQLDAWLADREATVPHLRPGLHKRIHWAGEAGRKTPVAVVYVHGFSATSEEIRPVPDLVAKALGANLHFGRLAGHGQDAAAMGVPRLADWMADTREAIAVGHAIGERVLVISCSTGCSLVIRAVADGAQADMLSLVSPNFGMAFRPLRWLLSLPGLRHWGPILAGRERGFEPISPAHEAAWTTRYDLQAVFTMGDAIRAVLAVDVAQISVPVLTHLCLADRVVAAPATQKIMSRWGGTSEVIECSKGRDANGHILAGDVFNPAQTKGMIDDILRRWRGL